MISCLSFLLYCLGYRINGLNPRIVIVYLQCFVRSSWSFEPRWLYELCVWCGSVLAIYSDAVRIYSHRYNLLEYLLWCCDLKKIKSCWGEHPFLIWATIMPCWVLEENVIWTDSLMKSLGICHLNLFLICHLLLRFHLVCRVIMNKSLGP